MAILHMIGGTVAVLAVPLMFVFVPADKVAPLLGAAGLTFSMVLLSVLIGGLIVLVSGIGLWRGVRRGWQLALFYYSHRAAANIQLLFFLPSAQSQGLTGNQDLTLYYARYGGRVFFSLLFASYLLMSRPMAFCGVTRRQSRLPAILGVSLVLAQLPAQLF